MFRAPRSLLRLAARPRTRPLPRPCPVSSPASSPLPWPVAIARFASASDKPDPPPPKQPIDRTREKELGQRIIEPRPDEVTAESSVRHVMESSPARDDADLGLGLKHDINIVRDTFRLSQVPQESHILGLAGTLPYLATSLSTVFLAWDLSKQLPTGNALYDAIFVDHETAQYLLSVIEPLQLGYGAVIISFLGAIHWGLEYAEKQPLLKRTRFRYGIGVVASIVAWPTLLMPVEYALTSQFLAFVALYFADSRAAVRGWAPPWYGMYRFLLTAMVGLAILISLVGRAHISTHGRLTSQGLTTSMLNPGIADRDTDWAKLEAEEKERIRKEKEEAERKAKKEAAARKKEEKKGSKNSGANKDGKGESGTKSEANGQEADDGKDGADASDEDSQKQGDGDGKNEADNEDQNGDDESESESESDDKQDQKADTQGDKAKPKADGDGKEEGGKKD